MTSQISPRFAPQCRRSSNGQTLRRIEKRRLWANVAAHVGLSVVVAVDDADDFFLLISRNADAFKCFSCSAVGADCDSVHAGVCRSLIVDLPTFRTSLWRSYLLFHYCTPFPLMSKASRRYFSSKSKSR